MWRHEMTITIREINDLTDEISSVVRYLVEKPSCFFTVEEVNKLANPASFRDVGFNGLKVYKKWIDELKKRVDKNIPLCGRH
jgi:hypothetical protein